MFKIIDLFEIVNGIFASNLDIQDIPTERCNVPLLRPSSSFQQLIAGFINAEPIPSEKIFSTDSLIVSTDGEGSHSYSYVVPYRFVANSNVCVLIPREVMSLKCKLFYSLAITQSRWRYSYGRKPKGNRLEQLELPQLPSWINAVNIPNLSKQVEKRIPLKEINKANNKKILVRISDLFDIKYGTNYELNHLTPDPNGIAFISRTRLNNGISGRVARTKKVPTPPGCLTVALGGSVLETFYQDEPTYQGRDMDVLTPKVEMHKNELIWYATAIRQHQFRFNFGRQANRTLDSLLIPKYPKTLSMYTD